MTDNLKCRIVYAWLAREWALRQTRKLQTSAFREMAHCHACLMFDQIEIRAFQLTKVEFLGAGYQMQEVFKVGDVTPLPENRWQRLEAVTL